jgi:uncharacterized protein
MRYLIDGYNLLFALGLLREKSKQGELKKARTALLQFLHDSFGNAGGEMTVIFDAAHHPRDQAACCDYEGIHVQFATEGETADDLIESIIKRCQTPAKLTVVSNDRRLLESARRKGCLPEHCPDFLDRLQHLHPVSRRRQAPTDKPSGDTDSEHWTRVFADLQADKSFKELREPVEWFEMGDDSQRES